VPRTRIRSVLLPLLALVLAALALAACGGGTPSSSGKSDEEKRLAFEDCLRDHGVDVQTSADGRGSVVRMSARAGVGGKSFGTGGPDDQHGPFAICRRKTGWAPSPPTAQEQAEMRDRGLRMARCMRGHGVDMPDPAPDGRMMLRVPRDSPTFEAAARACGIGVPGSGKAPDAGFAVGPR
jgi:hypothetical protein